MMKKTVAIVAVLLVLGVAFFVVSSTDEEPVVSSPWEIPAVEEIARLEIERPDPSGQDRQKLIFERTGQTWRITSPVEAGVAPHVAKKIVSLFSAPIEMDDLELSSDDLEQYGLDAENRLDVTVVAPNAEPVTLVAGDGMRVSTTGARRTYVLGPRGDVFRARTDLGIVFHQPVSVLREKNIFTISAEEMALIRLKNSGGETFEFVPDESGEWGLTKPDPGFEVERPLITSMVKGLAEFRVRQFLPGGREANGLDQATTIVTLGTKKGDRIIEVKKVPVEAGEMPRYLAALKGSDDVFELMPSLGGIVTGSRNTLRNRLTRSIGRGNLQRIELAGEAGVVLERAGDDWKQVSPTVGDTEPKELSKFLGNLENLTVIRYGDLSRAEAGLDPDSKPLRVVVTDVDGKEYVLLLGAREESYKSYWAAWEDGEDRFLLPEYLYKRLQPGPTDLLLSNDR